MEQRCQICDKCPAKMKFFVPKLSPDPIYTCGDMDQVGAAQVIPGVTWHCLAVWMNGKLGVTAKQWRDDREFLANVPYLQPIEKFYL